MLKLSGNIETHESVVGFKVPGRIVELPVEEGQWVEQGAVLAQLDNADYRQQVAMDRAAVGVQRSQLGLALAGTRRQQLQVAQQTLQDAQADLKQKQLDFNRADTLYREQVGPQQVRDQAETNLKRAQTVARSRSAAIRRGDGRNTQRATGGGPRATGAGGAKAATLAASIWSTRRCSAPKSGVILVRQSRNRRGGRAQYAGGDARRPG